MAEIVVVGGGLVGHCSAMLLAADGHSVTVLERDPEPPPRSADAAWNDWSRRGVNQFRMIHYFLPRFRDIVERDLPAVAAALDADGALRFNPLEAVPEQVSGGRRDGDQRHQSLTGRRPMVEAVVERVAATTPGVTVHRGVAVRGVLTADAARERGAARHGGRDGRRHRAPRRPGRGRRRPAVGGTGVARRRRRPSGARAAGRLRLRVLRPALPVRRRVHAAPLRAAAASVRVGVHAHAAGRQRHVGRRDSSPAHATPRSGGAATSTRGRRSSGRSHWSRTGSTPSRSPTWR